MQVIKYFLCFLFVTGSFAGYSQHFYRLKADFSIKSKNYDGKAQLTMGKVFYDKTHKKIVYKITFPEKETWLSVDSLLYKIVANEQGEPQVFKQKIPGIAEFSIFHLAMNGQLSDFGLKKSNFRIEKVEREDNKVITTWLPPARYTSKMGKIMIANEQKKITGIIFFDTQNKILSKQFFNKYQNFDGLVFPTEIIQITYINGNKNRQITTYRNIAVNETGNDKIYNFKLPE